MIGSDEVLVIRLGKPIIAAPDCLDVTLLIRRNDGEAITGAIVMILVDYRIWTAVNLVNSSIPPYRMLGCLSWHLISAASVSLMLTSRLDDLGLS